MNTRKLTFFILLGMAALCCHAQRFLGGDISLLPSYIENGTKYLDYDGKEMAPLELFKQEGWNAMRVRLFVDPANASAEHKSEGVCQDLDYVVGLSKEIKKAGFKLMLDFHYSDTWADPAKQFTPKRWAGVPAGALCDSVYAYTSRVLEVMNREGVTPEMIQVGNEITFGMLWETGRVDPLKADNWDMLGALLRAGSKACREKCPQAKLIIHTEHAQDWASTKGYYTRLEEQKVDYDIIGLSYYPMWHGTIPHLGEVLDSLKADFAKPVMIVEAACYYSHHNDKWANSEEKISGGYPVSIEGQREFTRQLVDELLRHDNVTGLFWWFPEENAYGNKVIDSWLNRGLFDNATGRALPAMKEMRRFNAPL